MPPKLISLPMTFPTEEYRILEHIVHEFFLVVCREPFYITYQFHQHIFFVLDEIEDLRILGFSSFDPE